MYSAGWDPVRIRSHLIAEGLEESELHAQQRATGLTLDKEKAFWLEDQHLGVSACKFNKEKHYLSSLHGLGQLFLRLHVRRIGQHPKTAGTCTLPRSRLASDLCAQKTSSALSTVSNACQSRRHVGSQPLTVRLIISCQL